MSVLAFNPFAHELRETNRRLRFWLERVEADAAAGTEPRAPTAEDISALLSQLMRAGEWLRTRAHETDPELDFELTQYREQVERLRSFLPVMHRALLRERTRLEQEGERLNAAAHWANASQQTL